MHLEAIVSRVQRARAAAHGALGVHESAASRVILLENVVKRLSGSPVDVQDYFREAVTCLENGLYRAAIVMSWAGYFHVFSETLYQQREGEIRTARGKWTFKDLSDLKEGQAESQIIDAARDIKFINRATARVLQGQLAQRNQCAHPTLYRPSMNGSVGYVDQMVRQALEYVAP